MFHIMCLVSLLSKHFISSRLDTDAVCWWRSCVVSAAVNFRGKATKLKPIIRA